MTIASPMDSFCKFMPSAQSKYYVFTINNHTVEEEKGLSSLYLPDGPVTYVTFGREVGESGTPHLQGYIELRRKTRLRGVKALPGLSRAHLEIRRGSADEARIYCHKDGDFVQYGVISKGPGQRKDLLQVQRKLDEGVPMVDIAQEHFGSYVRYHKSFEEYRNLRLPKLARDVEVYCLYGLPGTGKTRFVFESFPDCYITSDPTLKWFDGYMGEEVMLIDDYRGDGVGSFLLRLLDRYPLRLPVKGGHVPMAATKVFITSNMEPPFGHGDIIEPLRRRFKKVIHLNNAINFEDPSDLNRFREKLNLN